jgi:hypothetical protein
MAKNGYIPNIGYLRWHSPHSFREDGSLKPFVEQLRDLDQYRSDELLILAEHSEELHVVYGSSKPLVLAKKKIDLIKKYHSEVVSLLPYLPELIKNSPMAIESRQRKNSLVFVLNPGVPINSSKYNMHTLIPVLPIHFDQTVDYIEVDKIASVYGKLDFEEFLVVNLVAGKRIYINENFARWSGDLPRLLQLDSDSPRHIYFNLGLDNNQEKLQTIPVFVDKPSDNWVEANSLISIPEGFRWVTNGKANALEFVVESRKYDGEAVFCYLLEKSTNKLLHYSATFPNLPPKAVEFLAQHKNKSVRDTLAQNPTISPDVLKVYGLKRLHKDDVITRSKIGKKGKTSKLDQQQKRHSQQQRKNGGLHR